MNKEMTDRKISTCLVVVSVGLFFPDASTRTVEQEEQLSQIIRTVEREALQTKTHGQFG